MAGREPVNLLKVNSLHIFSGILIIEIWNIFYGIQTFPTGQLFPRQLPPSNYSSRQLTLDFCLLDKYPRKILPWTTNPRTIVPYESPPMTIIPQTITLDSSPLEKYPQTIVPREMPPRELPPELLLTQQFCLKNSPLATSPGQLPPMKFLRGQALKDPWITLE